ncbi:MAG: hypothetical protein IJF58_01395 [Clostridia bacterium]|nr:hypothetical protein [Clostridia bacterium]
MLYPKNKEAKLTSELFLNPTSEYRGTPFWAWNCELEKEELLRQLDVMKQMGLGGAHMHVRTGMATKYLSDEHMELIKACVEKCRDENMLAWLYDEDRWPSGAAGGIVTKEEKYRQRSLVMSVEAGREDKLLACYDVVLDDDGCLKSGKLIDADRDAEGTKWYAYLHIRELSPWWNNQTYVNTLDPAAMKRFIEVTYDRYLETVGDDFGGLIPAIFTDEPQISFKKELPFAKYTDDITIPWTDDLPQTYAKAYGEDLLKRLPEIFWQLPNGELSLIRYHYHDHICERFTQAFADQCGGWCRDHNLMLTGHMLFEDNLEYQTIALGEAMRAYRGFDLPGIDMLCDGRNFATAKQAQSAVHQYGREGMLSELYGVTGWDFDFRGHKFQGDWQAALGVTVRVHHLFWVSMKGEAKRDYPASIGYQSPWWKDYSLVENHFARVNTALTRGKPVVKVGVIHPIESYWINFGPADQTGGKRGQINEHFLNLTRWLIEGMLDFDFISESLLPDLCEGGSAPLKVGKMEYDTILVPDCEILRGTTYERLKAFKEQGGKLIFIGNAPKYIDGVPDARGEALWQESQTVPFAREAVFDALEAERIVDIRRPDGIRTDNLIHQLRQDGEDKWLFIAHSRSAECKDKVVPEPIRITVKGEYGALIYDTQTGAIKPASSTAEKGYTHIDATLYSYDSLLLKLTTEKVLSEAEAVNTEGEKLSVSALVEYELDEPNALLLDKAEVSLDGQAYRPEKELLFADNDLRVELNWPTRQDNFAQPWTVEEPRPEHSVSLRFKVTSDIEIDGVKLALEDADIAKIWINGKQITAKPDGWFVDKSIGTVPIGALQKGENIIEAELPFGKRTNVEWCYLLGDFGVTVQGEHRRIVAKPEKLGFDDIVRQGLAHYTGNVTYKIPVKTKSGALKITVPHYVGAAVKVAVDQSEAAVIYPPYNCTVPVSEGEHILTLTLLGNRFNAFGHLHAGDQSERWIGPNIWRTSDNWTESYRLRPLGIMTAPIIEQI